VTLAAAAGHRLTVVDLGLGNLGSVLQALRRVGGTPLLTSDAQLIARAPRLLLPGVAAFGLGMERARQISLLPALREALLRATPVLGICLGMQILFEEGEEDSVQAGLGLLPGKVTRLPAGVQVPHIGWQQLEQTSDTQLLERGRLPWAYFANSYRCEAPPEVTQAVVHHGAVAIAAVVGRGTLYGVQSHPEKSAQDGEALLGRFLALPEGRA